MSLDPVNDELLPQRPARPARAPPEPGERASGPAAELSEQEKAIYRWQMWTPDLGEEGQRKLKGASVLISRIGGVGGTAAFELAAAGVGRIIIAHAGNVRRSDLNRQL